MSRARTQPQDFFGSSNINMKSLFSFNDISVKTQAHLTKVYMMLMVCSLLCAFGMWVNSEIILSGFFINLISIIISVCIMI